MKTLFLVISIYTIQKRYSNRMSSFLCPEQRGTITQQLNSLGGLYVLSDQAALHWHL